TDLKIDYPNNFAKWKAYVDQFDPNKTIPELPAVTDSQEKGYLVAKNIYNVYYNIKSQESKLRKYVFRAPFSGVVDKAFINPGSMVGAGQNLGAFLNNNHFELEVGVSVGELSSIDVGQTVTLNSPDISGQWTGTVRRISKSIDPATQNVTVYVQVKGEALREGMYLTGNIGDGVIENAVIIPRKLLVDGDQVYLVKDNVLQLKTVEVVRQSGAEAVIKGLPSGSTLLNSEVSGIFEGMKVTTKPNL
ncbi:MAG TPA: HlyD family efflux transporter periplasmic adaptor subunit, partial [Bacteroidetes bacterium]|nr:HlyD family efflux transporter periplasmic adaptor subunit [Bacteroidota bacterium]